MTLPGIQPVFAPEATKKQINELLKQNYLPTDHITLSVNVLVLKSKSGVLLFDAGAGTAFGPSTGDGWNRGDYGGIGAMVGELRTRIAEFP